MHPYTLIYTVKDSPVQWRFANVTAEDADEAEQTFEAHHPDCDVIWINEGHDKHTME
jgi:hypothetical protein